MKVIYAVGDAATGNSDSQALADYIASRKPDAFLYLGDMYESGTAAEFQANYKPAWGQLDSIVYPIPGNHDWGNYSTGYKPYFDSVNRPSASNYMVSLEDWTLWMLNSEDISAAQSFMAQAPIALERKNIACWHRPRYCSGSHGDATDTDPLWQLLAPHCPVILGGHAHNAQVFKPDQGCRQIVSGAGGRGLYAEVPDDPRLQWGEANGYAVCRLELADTVKVSFEDHTGKVLFSD